MTDRNDPHPLSMAEAADLAFGMAPPAPMPGAPPPVFIDDEAEV
jgi:hypothetical protein